jgi:hypothetical protein
MSLVVVAPFQPGSIMSCTPSWTSSRGEVDEEVEDVGADECDEEDDDDAPPRIPRSTPNKDPSPSFKPSSLLSCSEVCFPASSSVDVAALLFLACRRFTPRPKSNLMRLATLRLRLRPPRTLVNLSFKAGYLLTSLNIPYFNIPCVIRSNASGL